MIWAATNEGGYKDDQMTSTQLDSHENMVVVVQHATIINLSGKSANVRLLSSDCSKLEAVPIVNAVVAYDFPHTLDTFILDGAGAERITPWGGDTTHWETATEKEGRRMAIPLTRGVHGGGGTNGN